MQSCKLDLIPTKIIKKKQVDKFAPLLSLIVSKSLNKACFPDRWKITVMRPLIKKCNLDRIDKNYRSVSNHAFKSKFVEKAVLYQLNEHCTYNDIHAVFQSAYKEDHSCEAALLKVVNVILWTMHVSQPVFEKKNTHTQKAPILKKTF